MEKNDYIPVGRAEMDFVRRYIRMVLNNRGYHIVGEDCGSNDGNLADEELTEVCTLLEERGFRLVKKRRETYGEMAEEEIELIVRKEEARARRLGEQARVEAEVNNPQLIAALKKWRSERARKEDVPAYFVLSNMTLLLIAKAAPATTDELLAVKGFGPRKAEKFGVEILSVVAREMEEVYDS